MASLSELRQRYDARVPRYTSYPTAPHFHDIDQHAAIEALGRGTGALSLYLHIPFCEQLCWYCGCHQEIVHRNEIAEPYIDTLLAEFDLVRGHLAPGRSVAQLALGGGTPSFLSCAQLERLIGGLKSRLPFEEVGEYSIELDPRTVDEAKLETLVGLGFNRFSMGVQDLDDEVMEAVNRPQPAILTERAIAHLRTLGDASIGIDLLYGLPVQTPDRFAATVMKVVDIRPSRISLFPYAHVPWIKPSQKILEKAGLPNASARLEMLDRTRELLGEHGYGRVGMDHFALHGDPLLTAQHDGSLNRNFQGYTTMPDLELIGLGVSSIGFYGDLYAQNIKARRPWREKIEAGQLPIERGLALSEDDRVRHRLIMDLMCSGRARWAKVGRQASDFSAELDALAPLAADGLLRIHPEGVDLSPVGIDFARNAAAVFDTYLGSKAARYSRTV